MLLLPRILPWTDRCRPTCHRLGVVVRSEPGSPDESDVHTPDHCSPVGGDYSRLPWLYPGLSQNGLWKDPADAATLGGRQAAVTQVYKNSVKYLVEQHEGGFPASSSLCCRCRFLKKGVNRGRPRGIRAAALNMNPAVHLCNTCFFFYSRCVTDETCV